MLLLLILVSSLNYAQEGSNKKFQLGVSYAFTNESKIFKSPISLYGSYQLKRWDNLDVNVGLRTLYFGSKVSANFTDKLGINPNISTSYFFAKNKCNGSLSVGYYFDSFESEPTITGVFVSPKRDIKTNGITITTGLKYFFHPRVFVDANTTFIIAETKDTFYKKTVGTTTFLNIGLGVAF